MILPDIVELQLVGVFDRGEPNRERIVIKSTSYVNLAQYGVLLGYMMDNGMAVPYRDNFYHFPEKLVLPNTWVFLYTGPGTDQETTRINTQEPAWVFHWQRPSTIFAQSRNVPVIFKMDSVLVGAPPVDLPQLKT